MKKLELGQMGVQEMDAVEVKSTDGGIFGIDDAIIAGILFVIGGGLGFLFGRKATEE